jgi:hypothetical protein
MTEISTAQVANAREEKQMSNEKSSGETDWRQLGQRDETTDDRTFLDALNGQFEAFFGLDELRRVLDPEAYIEVRAAVADRPMHHWRPMAAAATALAKGGMTSSDIATYGLDATDRIGAKAGYGRHEDIAALIAMIAAMYALSGEQIRTIETVIEHVVNAVHGGF